MTRLAIAAIALAVLAVLVQGAGALGARFGFWGFRTGFTLLRVSAWAGLAAALFGAASALPSRERRVVALSALGIFLGAGAAGVPWIWMRLAKSSPAIHDITTDTEDPPKFAAILERRKDAPNSPEYGGPEIAKLQKAAYPEIVPVELQAPPAEAFRRSLEAAKRMQWELVAIEPAEGRIEATAYTRWFQFKDDVIVRVRPAGRGSRVDARSVSRVGKGDVGTNARRLRRFLRLVRG